MNTRKSIYKLPLHQHPLFYSARFARSRCAGCHIEGSLSGGYFCNEPKCISTFHEKCAEAPLEINHHPSHPKHPLLLKNSSMKNGTPCDLCGNSLLSPCYTCPTCEFRVDLICGTKPPPSTIEHSACHNHPLVFLKKRDEIESSCQVCKESIRGPSYSCLECSNVYFHLDCVHLSKEINYSCHSAHPLKIITSESLIDDGGERSCHFCAILSKKVFYHCSICNFTVCLDCTTRPPPLTIDDAKTHPHPLSLFSSKLSFICKIAGAIVDSYKSYICLKCDFVVAGQSVALPRIININRHNHRLFFTHHIGRGGAKCGVCRGRVRQYYGGYSCSICPNYAVHTYCISNVSVWDGVELEGIPETNEDIVPFQVVGDNLIRHFAHEKHILLLLKDYVMGRNYYELLRCEACICPVGFGPFYKCQRCHFVLHEKCANLPMKKKLIFDSTAYKLQYFNTSKNCELCGVFSSGFKYTVFGPYTSYRYVDVHCGSISEPFVHDLHLHPLYFGMAKNHCCNACKRVLHYFMLTCDTCHFSLCLYCATLPEKIWHMSDEHPLTLYYSKTASGKNWCEVCETELDPSKWFYTCSDCGVTLHVQCVLGDFSRLKPNWYIVMKGKYFLVVSNNHNSRPFCKHCHYRCTAPVILNDDDEQNGYVCSIPCLTSCLGVTTL